MKASTIITQGAMAALAAAESSSSALSPFTRIINSAGVDTTVTEATTFTSTVPGETWTVRVERPVTDVTIWDGESNTYTDSFASTDDFTQYIPESEALTYTGSIEGTVHSFVVQSSPPGSAAQSSGLTSSTLSTSVIPAHSFSAHNVAADSSNSTGSTAEASSSSSSSSSASSSSTSSESGAVVSDQVTFSVVFGSILSLIYLL